MTWLDFQSIMSAFLSLFSRFVSLFQFFFFLAVVVILWITVIRIIGKHDEIS